VTRDVHPHHGFTCRAFTISPANSSLVHLFPAGFFGRARAASTTAVRRLWLMLTPSPSRQKSKPHCSAMAVNVNQRTGQETPVRRIGVVLPRVVFQPRGGVIFRIEGDRQQMPVRQRVGLAQEFFLDLLKVARHKRAKRRERTAVKMNVMASGLSAGNWLNSPPRPVGFVK